MNITKILNIVFDYLHGMWRFRWYAAAVSWAIAVAGWLAVYSLPPVYEATARIHVNTETTLKPLLQGLAVNTDVMSEVNVVTQAMLSRPQLEEVMREAELDLRATSDAALERELDRLRVGIRISRDRFENTFTITYSDESRSKAINVVDTLLDNFIEDTLGASRSDTQNAQRFLESQIADYERKLTEAEQRLADFKKSNVGRMPGEGGDYYQRFQTAVETEQSLMLQLELAQERRGELAKQIEGEVPVFGIVSSSAAGTGPQSEYDRQIADYEKQLADLSLRFTDRHPDIVRINEIIDQLRERKAEETAMFPGAGLGGAANPLQENPVYQSMRIALSEVEVEIATLRAQLTEQRRAVANLREMIDTIPEVEARLNRLNRDYDVTKVQYEALLGRLQTARLSEEADNTTDDVQFRVVEPTFAATAPIGPPRLVLLAIVFVGAIAIGVASTFVLDQFNPTFFSSRMVREAVGLPVIGLVSAVADPRAERRALLRNVAFMATLSLLVVAFALSLVLVGYAEQFSLEGPFS